MKKHNLLFLYTDEQAIDTLKAYGNDKILMPNLNRLSEDCTVFEQAYVTQPVCTPSRSTLLTGLYPHANGCTENNIPLPPDVPCFPELLDDPEYVCAHYGKWHLGDELYCQHGFDEWVSIEDGYYKYNSPGRNEADRSNYHHFLIKHGFTPKDGSMFDRGETAALPEAYSKPAFLAEASVDFINRNRDNPFVLYVNFLEPHMPYTGPRDDMYDLSEIPLPDNFEARPGIDTSIRNRYIAEFYAERGFGGVDLSTPDGWKRIKANYWGLCSQIDTYIGKIIDHLKELELYDDTIIVFTSDHGDMMGSHGLLAKCVMYEEAVRVPFLIKLPGQHENKKVSGPVSQIDIVPTLLDCLYQQTPETLQGKSLKSLIEAGGTVPKGNNVFIEWFGTEGRYKKNDISPQFADQIKTLGELEKHMGAETRTVVTPDGWKYCWNPVDNSELYDLNNDPQERINLATDSRYADKISKFRNIITRWSEKSGYPG